jgi:predicted HicB family RNase H-like nuclease
MGRPPKPPAQKMSQRICVRLTPEQYRRLVHQAKQAGLSLSAFILRCLEV